jgi:hypothetical protein
MLDFVGRFVDVDMDGQAELFGQGADAAERGVRDGVGRVRREGEGEQRLVLQFVAQRKALAR